MLAEQIAAFIDRRLTDAERLGMEAHLADCVQCRAEVVEVRRLVLGSSHRRRTYAMMSAALAIAAAALLVVSTTRHSPTGQSDRVLRGGHAAVLTAIGPHGTVPRAGLTLVWSAAGNGAAYRITLSDAAGRSVWASDSRDTSVVVPAVVALSPGTDYFWTVDATLPEGSSRTTTAQSFRIAR